MYLGTHPGHQRREHIGHYLVAKPTVYTNHYECAAWYENVLVAPGRFELFTNGYYLFATLTGTNDGDYFQSLYCGVAVGRAYDGDQNKGRAATYHVQSYLYDLPRMMEAGRVVLLDGYTFHTHHQFVSYVGTQWPQDRGDAAWRGPRGYWAQSLFPVRTLALPRP